MLWEMLKMQWEFIQRVMKLICSHHPQICLNFIFLVSFYISFYICYNVQYLHAVGKPANIPYANSKNLGQPAHVQADPGLCCLLYKYYVKGEWKPSSDCADILMRLGFRNFHIGMYVFPQYVLCVKYKKFRIYRAWHIYIKYRIDLFGILVKA